MDAERTLRDNPTLELGGGARFRDGERSPEVEVGLGQAFELGGQRGARVEAAKAGQEGAAAGAEDATRRTLHAVGAAFLRVRHAEERRRVASDAERLAADLRRVAQRRHEAGASGALDFELAALTLARVQTELRTVEAAREQALGELRRLLGLEAEAEVALRGALLDRQRYTRMFSKADRGQPTGARSALTELLAQAPERADLRALEAEAREAEAEARLGAAQRWPELGVRVGYAHEEEAHVIHGGLAVTLPVFDRGQGLEATARARAKAARVEREAVEAAIGAQVRSALARYQRLLDAVEHFEAEGLPRVERSEALARRTYEAGAMQLAELLTIRRELVGARLIHTDLLLRTALAGLELEAQVGALR